MIGREDGCSGHVGGACGDQGHREKLVMMEASLVRSMPKPTWSREVGDGGYKREEGMAVPASSWWPVKKMVVNMIG